MANWNYNHDDYEDRSYQIIPVGNYRVRISEVTERTFKSGNEGFEIKFDVSGQSGKLWFYIVLNKADVKQTNQNLGTFFECFGIGSSHLGNGQQWVGKVGGVRVKHEQYNGSMTAKVHYLLNKAKQEDLPPWQEKASAQPQTQGYVEIKADDLPFM